VARDPSTADWHIPGMRATLNGTGFMFEVRDRYADEFIAYAGQIDEPVLDIGCAFGVATIPALEAGATVTACDMEPRHLDELRKVTPAACLTRLECVVGQLPAIDLPQEKFGAILCSRVLHFLDGSAIDASVRAMHRWLKPGGRLYLVADTPYGIWRNYIPIFEAKRERGDRWPGLMIGLENYLPTPPRDRAPDGPPFMNLLDPALLARTCAEAGFHVERASFIDRSDFAGLGSMDGRENAGILATKPA
jgi:SAM-dependent methyltransferase